MMNRSAFLSAALLACALPAAAQTPAKDPYWITATNTPCKVWNPQPQPNESVTWSGACKDGLITGKGLLRWLDNGKVIVEFDGEFRGGKRNGPGVLIAPDGKRSEGVWVGDELLEGNKPI